MPRLANGHAKRRCGLGLCRVCGTMFGSDYDEDGVAGVEEVLTSVDSGPEKVLAAVEKEVVGLGRDAVVVLEEGKKVSISVALVGQASTPKRGLAGLSPNDDKNVPLLVDVLYRGHTGSSRPRLHELRRLSRLHLRAVLCTWPEYSYRSFLCLSHLLYL